MPQVSIVVPAYNEEHGVGVVAAALKALPLSTEIIVVDDGSTDGTASAAEHAGARVVRHPINMGYGASVKDGILAASNDTILITDADGTYPIQFIPELLNRFQEGFDMVVGARQGAAFRRSLIAAPTRLLFTWLVEFVTGRHIPDVNSGLRVFRKKDVLPYFQDLCNGFSFTTTQTLIFFLTGKMISYVPIPYAARIGKSKVRIMRDSLRTLQYITECAVRYNPLKVFLLLSVLSLLFGIVSAWWLGPMGVLVGSCAAVIVFALGLRSQGIRS